MRALMVLVALVAVPFAAGVAQGKGVPQRSKQCAKFAAHEENEKARDRDRDGDRERDSDKDKDGDREHRKQCPPADPPPPPPPPPSPAPVSSCGPTVSGNAVISGSVTNSSFAAVPGVCVQIFVNGSVVAGATTDVAGNYSASVLANGETFLVCSVAPAGATQSWPASGIGFPVCPSGLAGYGFVLTAGGSGLMASFTF